MHTNIDQKDCNWAEKFKCSNNTSSGWAARVATQAITTTEAERLQNVGSKLGRPWWSIWCLIRTPQTNSLSLDT